VGQKIPSVQWHVRHLNRPTDTSPGSIMPRYQWLLEEELDFEGVTAKIKAMKDLGVPYDEELENGPDMARAQAEEIFAKLVEEDPTFEGSGLEDKKIMAVVAYLLRLGTDITKPAPAAEAEDDATVASR
jgi:cytochrome c oxidase cbb3-type subunit I/II